METRVRKMRPKIANEKNGIFFAPLVLHVIPDGPIISTKKIRIWDRILLATFAQKFCHFFFKFCGKKVAKRRDLYHVQKPSPQYKTLTNFDFARDIDLVFP